MAAKPATSLRISCCLLTNSKLLQQSLDINVNIADNEGDTPLIEAAVGGANDSVALLLNDPRTEVYIKIRRFVVVIVEKNPNFWSL